MQRFVFTLFLVYVSCVLSAQVIPKNQYGLPVVNTTALYHRLVAKDSSQRLVDLQRYIPGIRLKIYYATRHNFTHHRLYKSPQAFLRLPAAKALKAVAQQLKGRGLGLLIFDGYRPYAVTEKMWQIVPDDRYAANPRNGSRHNRGVAVDLTLVHLKSGKPLAMPTGFDNFTDKAHRDYMALPDSVIANRKILENAMVKHGFIPLSTEWWHFSLKDPGRYPLMNLKFKALEK
jgi:D-alanyl-D-alanine dipeptidase